MRVGSEDDDQLEADGADEEETTDQEMDEAEQVARAKAMAQMLRPSEGGAFGACSGEDKMYQANAEHTSGPPSTIQVGCCWTQSALTSNAGKDDGKPSTSAGLSSIDAAMAELDMEHYDDEDEEVPGLFGTGKHPGMAYYSRAEDDPYLAKEASDSEDDELTLSKTDFLILAARNEDDVSHLEVRLFRFHVICCGTVLESFLASILDLQHGVLCRFGYMKTWMKVVSQIYLCIMTSSYRPFRSQWHGWTATSRTHPRPQTLQRCAQLLCAFMQAFTATPCGCVMHLSGCCTVGKMVHAYVASRWGASVQV